jgi:hypothetical protein
MPLITRPLTNNLPIVTAHVGVGLPRREELRNAGLFVPDRVRAELLISTGAKTSVIDRATLTALGLGEGEAQYDVSLKFSFDQGRPLILDTLPVTVGEFGGQGYDGIMGRDALAACVVTINGESFTLTF